MSARGAERTAGGARIVLACTVRGCGAPLARAGSAWTCAAGHAYDVAREGYVNLLQPQDRRAREPGDARASVEARARLWRAGLYDALAARLDAWSESAGSLVDVGCGSGELLARLARGRPAAGIDLSSDAIRAAARAAPERTWVVANAERGLPLASASVDCILSVTAPRLPAELRRVLAREGRALVVLPGPDDLVELRRAVLGEGEERDRAATWIERFAPHFALAARETVRTRERLAPATLADVALATYRAGRAARAEKLAALGAMDVTLAFELLVWS